MNLNLFFVESPFQALCANEAKWFYKLNNNLVIVRLSSEARNNSQIKEIVSQSDWKFIVYLKYKKFLPYQKLSIFCQMLYVKCQFRKFDNVFISYLNQSLQTNFLSYIKFNELFLIDDGTMTISYYNQIKKGTNVFFESLISHNKSPKLTLFTLFDLPMRSELNVQKNDFNYLKSLFKDKRNIKKKIVWFIGGNWVEFGSIDSESYYEKIKSEVQKINGNCSVHYLAHRREEDENLVNLKTIENLTVVNNIEPLELKLLKSKDLPQFLITFTSTSIFTLRLLFPEIKIILLDHNVMNLERGVKMRCDEYKDYWESLNID